ncbi:MAG TPA: hypothetical protein VJM12_09435 [Pyrinomonadaceae bacterium]|nr:hypothetical protein [Pyrinomonadaceae bacterium]
MAEERTLGLARAPEADDTELSKSELQLRMDEARDSISQTVTEIKETVAHQYESVKDALDWREHFKKRPVAWTIGAAGVGFCMGYCIAAFVKGDETEDTDRFTTAQPYRSAEGYGSERYAYASQPILGQSAPSSLSEKSNGKDEGPGLIERFKETRAFDRLQQEVGNLGDRLVDELSTTAQTVVLPAIVKKVREWIGADLSDKSQHQSPPRAGELRSGGTYQPQLERNPT